MLKTLARSNPVALVRLAAIVSLPVYWFLFPFGVVAHAILLGLWLRQTDTARQSWQPINLGDIAKILLLFVSLWVFSWYVIYHAHWFALPALGLFANAAFDVQIIPTAIRGTYQGFRTKVGEAQGLFYVAALASCFLYPAILASLFPSTFWRICSSLMWILRRGDVVSTCRPAKNWQEPFVVAALFVVLAIAFLGAAFFEAWFPIQRLGGFSTEFSISDLFASHRFSGGIQSFLLITILNIYPIAIYCAGAVGVVVIGAALLSKSARRSGE